MYYEGIKHYDDILFLESQFFVSFKQTVDQSTPGVKDGILPAGSIIPSNDEKAKAITINDIDVSHGTQLVGGIVEGYINAKRLPVVPTADAVKALPKITFSNLEEA